jgi:hypothetical protein
MRTDGSAIVFIIDVLPATIALFFPILTKFCISSASIVAVALLWAYSAYGKVCVIRPSVSERTELPLEGGFEPDHKREQV